MNNKFEQFCMLRMQGKTKDEIAREMGISVRTFYNYDTRLCLMEAQFESGTARELTPANYYRMTERGFCLKEELAEYFGVSRPTLDKYLKKWNAHTRIIQGLYVLGYNKERILHCLPLRKQGIDSVAQHVDGLPNLKGIARNLQVVINILKDFEDFDTEISDKIQLLEKAKEEISAVREKWLACE